MLRVIILVTMVFVSLESHASDNQFFYKDWRLDKPFVHGLLVGLSFGVVEGTPKQWQLAHELEPFGIPSGMLPYIEQHKIIPFRIGIFSALVFWLYLIGCITYRYYNREKYQLYISKVLFEKDDDYRKKLLANVD